ncbi:MAG: OmpA family protein [Bacteroidales bacterium]|nr:OmpA family protein [Bacteroidales bacterium]
MKKVIITLSVLLLTTVSAFAGGGKENNRYYTPKLSQGWFVDLAGTYSLFVASGCTYQQPSTYYGSFNKTNPKNLFGFSAKVGRRVSPSIAVRAGYDWHKSYNRRGDFFFESFHVDVMESPIDLFMGYNPDRLYTMWLYGGLGLLAYDNSMKKIIPTWGANLELGAHIGIMNSFRINDSFDFHIDLTSVVTRWSYDDNWWDKKTLWHRMHLDLTAMAGIQWYIGGRTLDNGEVVTKTVETDCSEQERRIQELLDQLTQSQAQQGSTNSGEFVQTEGAKTDTIFVEGESLSFPFSVFFNKGSYDLRDGRDRVNLGEIAKVAKDNGYNIILRGTCDSGTASSAFNKTLAENRCNKVKAELVKLGVKESNITINAVGGVKELTPAEYDRRVLIQLSK